MPLMSARTAPPPDAKKGMSASTATLIIAAMLGASLLATGVVVATNAVISIDGRPSTSNPVVGRQPRDGAIHVIRVEAAGYEPREESVTFDRSFLVTVELKAAAGASSAKGGVRKWKAAPRGGAGKSGAPSGTLDTENPYQ